MDGLDRESSPLSEEERWLRLNGAEKHDATASLVCPQPVNERTLDFKRDAIRPKIYLD